ncbi:MAG: S1 RNA-binding domain-containing protein [Nitrospirales bacterium]|nr:S1 RNA-binding domain-containing protein [Nitrospirales bacterium]
MSEELREKDGETGQETFAELLEQSAMPARIEAGKKVKARVIGMSGGLVFIDLGGKSEGVIDIQEFAGADGQCQVKEGDEVEAIFLFLQDGLRKFTTLVHGYPQFKLKSLLSALEEGLSVSGEVKKEVKGGYEITVDGVRCFCPQSQMDLRMGGAASAYVGNTFDFKVLRFEENGRNIVLSRKAILEEERQKKIEVLKGTLQVGADATGIVRSLQNFGAFVDLGGMDGLIPMSEMAWDRVEKADELLTLGQTVTARIISLDWENQRITLSLKALTPDPWLSAAAKYAVGSIVPGTVVRLAPFGAFVRLESGIEGLVHISNLGAGRRVKHPKEVLEPGQVVEAHILGVDAKEKRISLSLQQPAKKEEVTYPSVGEIIDGTVEKVMAFGIFVKIGGNVTGLIPNSEMGTSQGADHTKQFPGGSTVKVVVKDVDTEKGRVTLSRKDLVSREEEDEVRSYMKSVQEPSSGMGILGEKLKAMMDEGKLKIK